MSELPSERVVFILDDSELSLEVTSAALERAGFEVHTFSSPFELSAAIDREKPVAIVVDLMMPTLGGDKVVDILRRNTLHVCPVLIYSSVPVPELASRAHGCGADAYVRKTNDVAELVRTVLRLVSY